MFSQLWGVGQVGGGYMGWPTIVYMSSGKFRGKESSNRIEISQLVQDLLNFGVLGSLRLWGGAGGGRCLGAWGYSHTCACTHTHTCTDMYICIEIANGCPHVGIHVYHVYNMHVHASMCACACMHEWDSPHTPTPTPPQSTHPQRGPSESVKNR